MGVGANAPIIIRRKKIVSEEGHHGGAWKVAYADFVTAMMAFFMLMWLLNATTEKQRKGIADYFSPTIPISRASAGGEGSLGGDSIFTQDTLVQHGVGGFGPVPTPDQVHLSSMAADDEPSLEEIEQMFLGQGGELLGVENSRQHIATKLTDEGFVVELFASREEPLFMPGTAEPTQLMQDLVAVVGDVFQLVSNDVAVKGHGRARAIVVADNPVWDRSISRAAAVRDMLFPQIGEERIDRVTGLADRHPATDNPMSPRNDRIEIILLRSDL